MARVSTSLRSGGRLFLPAGPLVMRCLGERHRWREPGGRPATAFLFLTRNPKGEAAEAVLLATSDDTIDDMERNAAVATEHNDDRQLVANHLHILPGPAGLRQDGRGFFRQKGIDVFFNAAVMHRQPAGCAGVAMDVQHQGYPSPRLSGSLRFAQQQQAADSRPNGHHRQQPWQSPAGYRLAGRKRELWRDFWP